MANNRASVEKRSEAYVFRNLLTRAFVAAAIAGLLFMVVHLSERVSGMEDKLAGESQKASVRPITAMKHLFSDAEAALQVTGHLVYLPMHSHIYAEGGQSFPLETTVSIRNADPAHSMTLISARYFDTKGSMLQEYVEAPKDIASLETVEFLIKKRDTRGGSGANMLIAWQAEKPIYPPVVEAIMIGRARNQDISFRSVGVALAERTR